MFYSLCHRKLLTSTSPKIREITGLILLDNTIGLNFYLTFENIQHIIDRSFLNHCFGGE